MLTGTKTRPWGEAALWLLFLGPFFFLLYGGAGWIASFQSGVTSHAFGWEAGIPFVPGMIVPYWSLDLFFAASLFLCRDRLALRRHAGRIVFVIVVAAACFVLFPMRFGFDRPPVDGVYGVLFGLLDQFDKPFNQAPSLHIALLTVLWPVYHRASRGLANLAIHAWFAMIGASVLLTWQHHMIDVPTGALLGLVALCLVPDRRPRRNLAPAGWEREARRQIGIRYRLGCLACLALTPVALPGSLLLLWPAASLAIVAAAYAWGGAGLLGKDDGTLSLPAGLVLAPYRFGALAFVRFRALFDAPWHEVAPNLLVGRLLTRREARRAIDEGVVAVLDLTAEFAETPTLLRLPYLNLPVLDLTAPRPAELRRAARFIERHRRRGKVYVHCALGYGRSACVAAAVVLAAGEADRVAPAIRLVRSARHHAVFSPVGIGALKTMKSGNAGRSSGPRPSVGGAASAGCRFTPATASAG